MLGCIDDAVKPGTATIDVNEPPHPSSNVVLSEYEGTWINPSLRENELSQLEITVDGDEVLIIGWISCVEESCRWDESAGLIVGTSLHELMTTFVDPYAVVRLDRNATKLKARISQYSEEDDESYTYEVELRTP